METVKPSNLRRYIYEYCLLALTACVIYLFIQIGQLNDYIRGDLQSQRSEVIKALYENTEYLKQAKNNLYNQNKQQ